MIVSEDKMKLSGSVKHSTSQKQSFERVPCQVHETLQLLVCCQFEPKMDQTKKAIMDKTSLAQTQPKCVLDPSLISQIVPLVPFTH